MLDYYGLMLFYQGRHYRLPVLIRPRGLRDYHRVLTRQHRCHQHQEQGMNQCAHISFHFLKIAVTG